MPENPNDSKVKTPEPFIFAWRVFIAFLIISTLTNFLQAAMTETLPYSRFIVLAQEKKLTNVSVGKQEITGTLSENGKVKKFRTVRIDDPLLLSRLTDKMSSFEGTPEVGFWEANLPWLIFGLFVLLGTIGSVVGQKGSLGAGLLSIERNKARVYSESNIRTTFDDVAGVDEAKAELQEVIGFLKEPARYSRLGGHMPKGILLVGPPGTGKTLLARAVAGEAKVPFFSISGSEFVEMFVGVGAARVRDLFSQAQKSAPCIIFIDELDALGRARGLTSIAGGPDEKEQTLNQLLVEMDGFDPRQGVVLLAATNRPEILDGALLRAGRFDRQILVDRPDKIGREQILKVHLRGIKADSSVKIEEIAGSTPGFTGADLANLVNEAVMLATRRGAELVEPVDFTNALERIVAGLEKKNRLLNPKEREIVAYHESGHALVSMSLAEADPVQKVSIIPRGIGALGYTMQRPTEDRFLMSKTELEAKLTALMGGRAAEMLVFEELSTGAADDLTKATDIARAMVSTYGMSKLLGPVTYTNEQTPMNSITGRMLSEGRYHSEQTSREIDCAVKMMVTEAFERSMFILRGKRSILNAIAQKLLENETLNAAELEKIVASETVARTKVACDKEAVSS
jgi:cell division protease FtsH